MQPGVKVQVRFVSLIRSGTEYGGEIAAGGRPKSSDERAGQGNIGALLLDGDVAIVG
jgi:hypothetical protein